MLSLPRPATELKIVDDSLSLVPLSGFLDDRWPELDKVVDEPRGSVLLLLELTKLFLALPPAFRLSQACLVELLRFLSNSIHSRGFSHCDTSETQL